MNRSQLAWRAPRRPPKACLRARARDERVARGRRVNRLGRVWRSGARISGGRVRHRTATTHVQNRLKRAWRSGARILCSRIRRATLTHVLKRAWRSGARVSCGRAHAIPTPTYPRRRRVPDSMAPGHHLATSSPTDSIRSCRLRCYFDNSATPGHLFQPHPPQPIHSSPTGDSLIPRTRSRVRLRRPREARAISIGYTSYCAVTTSPSPRSDKSDVGTNMSSWTTPGSRPICTPPVNVLRARTSPSVMSNNALARSKAF